MKRYLRIEVLRSAIIILVSVCIVSSVIGAISPDYPGSGNTITVLAAVQPDRYIVVDNNLQIISIVSNTQLDVIPNVVQNSLDGNAIPYTQSIRDQYLALKPTISFAKAGTVYQRQNGNLASLTVKRLLGSLQRFVLG